MAHQYNLSYLKNITRPCMLEFGFSLFQEQQNISRLVDNLRYLGLDAVTTTDSAASHIDKILVTNEGLITPLTDPKHIPHLCRMITTAADNANIPPCGVPHPVFAEQQSSPIRTELYDQTFAKHDDCLPNFMDYMLEQAAQSPKKLSYTELSKKISTPTTHPPLFSGSTIPEPYTLCSEFLRRNMKYATPTLSYALRFTNTRATKELSGHRLSSPEGKYFGFLHQYDYSSQQRFYPGCRLEAADGNFWEGSPIEDVTSTGYETAVFPDINPHQQTFLVWEENNDYMLFPIPEHDPKWQDFKAMCTPINKWLNYHGKEAEKARCLIFLQNPQQTFLPLIDKNIAPQNFEQFAIDQIQKSLTDNQTFAHELANALKSYQNHKAEIKDCDASLGKTTGLAGKSTHNLSNKTYPELLAVEQQLTAFQKDVQEDLKRKDALRKSLKKEQQSLQHLAQQYPFAHDQRKKLPHPQDLVTPESTYLLNDCQTTFKTATKLIKQAKSAHIMRAKSAIEGSEAFDPEFGELAKLVTKQDRQMFMDLAIETASQTLGINKQRTQTALHYACETYVSAPQTEQPDLLKPLYELRKGASKQHNRQVARTIAEVLGSNPKYQNNDELASLAKIDYIWSKPTNLALNLIQKDPQR